MVEKVSRDPVSVDKLEISGHDVMEILQIAPGPKVGQVLTILLNRILDNPEKNQPEVLKKMVQDLKKLSEEGLKEESRKAKEKIDQINETEDILIKEKHWVK